MNVKMDLEDLSLEELSFLSVYYATDQFYVNFLTSNKTRAERLDVCYGCEEHKVITEDDTDEEVDEDKLNHYKSFCNEQRHIYPD